MRGIFRGVPCSKEDVRLSRKKPMRQPDLHGIRIYTFSRCCNEVRIRLAYCMHVQFWHNVPDVMRGHPPPSFCSPPTSVAANNPCKRSSSPLGLLWGQPYSSASSPSAARAFATAATGATADGAAGWVERGRGLVAAL